MFKQGISEPALRALGIICTSKLGNSFYLAGGTAAAIQIGHRLSIDLDFFCETPFEGEKLALQLEQVGISFQLRQATTGTLHTVIEDTLVSFLNYPYPLLEPTIPFTGTNLASMVDIALMKIVAIASRGSKKDFVDLYYIQNKLGLKEIYRQFSKKYPIQKIEPYHYVKSLTYFEDADSEPDPLMLVDWNWETIKEELRKAVRWIEF